MAKWTTFVIVLAMVVVLLASTKEVVVYSGDYPQPTGIGKPIGDTVFQEQLKEEGYKLVFAGTPDSLKNQLPRIRITRIITSVSSRHGMTFTYFIDDNTKIVVYTTQKLRFKDGKIVVVLHRL